MRELTPLNVSDSMQDKLFLFNTLWNIHMYMCGMPDIQHMERQIFSTIPWKPSKLDTTGTA